MSSVATKSSEFE